jgi:small subunit ribosomal protein S27e
VGIYMKKNMILIPKPHTKFILVQCSQCDEKRVVFSHTTADLYCKKCGAMLVKKTGLKAEILGKVMSDLD